MISLIAQPLRTDESLEDSQVVWIIVQHLLLEKGKAIFGFITRS